YFLITCIISFLLTCRTIVCACEQTLTKGLLVRFIPAFITNSRAQSEQGIHIAGIPMHSRTTEPLLHDTLTGTLDTPASDGPPVLLKERIIHELLALSQIRDLFFEIFHLGMIVQETMNFF